MEKWIEWAAAYGGPGLPRIDSWSLAKEALGSLAAPGSDVCLGMICCRLMSGQVRLARVLPDVRLEPGDDLIQLVEQFGTEMDDGDLGDEACEAWAQQDKDTLRRLANQPCGDFTRGFILGALARA